MSVDRTYPKYATYQEDGRHPSLLTQAYPRPLFKQDETYYPPNKLLDPLLSSDQRVRFGAANFSAFLQDTIEVEHCLVIPAIAAVRRLPYNIPIQAEQDLYKLATDEGFHAEQSLQFLTDLRSHFALSCPEDLRTPLFLRRLEQQKSGEPNPMYRDLITVLNGVVTETRISIELSKFAVDKKLADSVRQVCRTHAEDESIHSSQFRALGQWLWWNFEEDTRTAAARFLTASTIARSMPDVDRLAYHFRECTGQTTEESRSIVYSLYTEDVLMDRLLVETKPTVSFLHELGADKYVEFEKALEEERTRLRSELIQKRRAAASG